MRSTKTQARAQGRVKELTEEFQMFESSFEESKLFTGPSTYFHTKTIQARRKSPGAESLLSDAVFLESLYATLTAWGMHRMGPGGAKLRDFDLFAQSIRRMTGQIEELWTSRIEDIAQAQLKTVTERVWDIVAGLCIGVGEIRLAYQR